MSWIVETVEDLRSLLEPFSGEMRVTPIEVDYVYASGGEAELKIKLTDTNLGVLNYNYYTQRKEVGT